MVLITGSHPWILLTGEAEFVLPREVDRSFGMSAPLCVLCESVLGVASFFEGGGH